MQRQHWGSLRRWQEALGTVGAYGINQRVRVQRLEPLRSGTATTAGGTAARWWWKRRRRAAKSEQAQRSVFSASHSSSVALAAVSAAIERERGPRPNRRFPATAAPAPSAGTLKPLARAAAC